MCVKQCQLHASAFVNMFWYLKYHNGDSIALCGACALAVRLSCAPCVAGETGAATKMKSVMNLLSGTVIAGLAESLALSEKVGLKPSEVMQVLEMSPMHCPLIKKLANGNFIVSLKISFLNLCDDTICVYI